MKRTFKVLGLMLFAFSISLALLFKSNMFVSALSAQEAVNKDIQLVNVPEKTIASFPVATKSVYGNHIAWESDNEHVVFMDGWFVVDRQVDEDIEATITVTVTKPNTEAMATRDFTVLVPKGVTKAPKYTITYYDAEGVDEFKSEYTLGEASFTLETPTKEDHIFLGWYTQREGGEKVEKILVGSNKNFNLYARWKSAIVTYKVEHYLEDLDGENYTLDKTEELAANIGDEVVATPLTYEGFTFNETLSTMEGVIPEEGTLILVAKYTRNIYELKVENVTVPYSLNLKYGEPIELEIPSKTGYEFDGWENFEETMPANDLTVSAKWKPVLVNYTVEYYLEDLDGNFELETTETLQGYTEAIVTAPDKDFTGFTFDAENANNVLSGEVLADGSLVLKKYYSRNVYSITFVLDNGEPNIVEHYKFGEAIPTPERPVKDGYVFIDWNPKLPATMPAENLILTAEWTQLEVFTVTFDSQGGTEVASQEVIDGYRATRPDDPEKEGYTFVAWFLDLEDEEPYDFTTQVEKSFTLYAKWEVNKYSITFDSDGGTDVEPIFVDFGAEITLPENPTKVGYIFVRWEPELPETMPAHNLEVKAVWTPVEYTITYVFYVGEEVYEGEVTNTNSTTYTIESEFDLVTAIIVDGDYFFAGWYTDNRFTLPINSIEKGLTEDMTIYGRVVSYEAALAEDLAILEVMYEDILTGEVVELESLVIKLPNGTEVYWSADKTAFSVNPVTGAVTITRIDEDVTVRLTAKLTCGDFVDVAYFEFIVPRRDTDTIAETRAKPLNSEVETSGIVTSLIGNNAFIQDETAGIYLFLNKDTSFSDKLVIGNEVSVKGKLTVFNGLLEIAEIFEVVVISTENTLPEPVVFEVIDETALLNLESQLVTINNLTIKSIPSIGTGSYNVKVTDGISELDLRIDASITNFDEVKVHFQQMIVGQEISLVNVPVGHFNGAPQIMISKVSEVVPRELTDAERIELDLEAIPSDLGTKTENFDLPRFGEYGSLINWRVVIGNEYVSIDGHTAYIERPQDEDVVVILMAMLDLEGEYREKEVTVTILKEGSEPTLVYDHGFEEDTNFSSYFNGDKTFGDVTWIVTEGLLNPDESDKLSATSNKMMRFRGKSGNKASGLETKDYINGLVKLELDMKYYSSNHSSAKVSVYKQVEGSDEWVKVGTTIQLTDSYTTYTFDVNESGNVKIKIVNDVNNKSWNLDNIKFYK